MWRNTKWNICSQSRAGLWPSEVLTCVKSVRSQNFERQNLYLLLTLEGTLKLKMKLIWTKVLQLTAYIYKDDCVKLRRTVLAQYIISLNIKTFKFCHFLRDLLSISWNNKLRSLSLSIHMMPRTDSSSCSALVSRSFLRCFITVPMSLGYRALSWLFCCGLFVFLRRW
jgi:hypothetical protein